MRATRLSESAVHRVAVIGGATAIVMVALLFAKPFYSAMTDATAPSSANESRAVANQEPATEEVSFVVLPTMETNPNSSSAAVTAATDITPNDQNPRRTALADVVRLRN